MVSQLNSSIENCPFSTVFSSQLRHNYTVQSAMLPVHNINYVIACLFDNKVEPRDYVHCISM